MQDKDSQPRILLDLNSILNAALLGGKDPDAVISLVDGKPESINSARYGVDRFFERFVSVLNRFGTAPRDVIGVWDGQNAKLFRQGILPGYKASTRSDGQYDQLNLARDTVTQMMRDMGAHTVKCRGNEADDVLAFLAKNLRTRKNIIVSGDGDLAVLVDDNTHVFNKDELDANPFGPFPHKYITLYKALVGDSSDKIPGAKGFGDAAFVKLVSTFGLDGLEAFDGLLRGYNLKALQEDVADLPELKKVLASEEQVYASWKAARIYPERVDTLRNPLEWTAGMVKQWTDLTESERVADLKPFYGTCSLVHAGNYDSIAAALAPRLATSPAVALDIETSGSEESEAWLEQTRSRGGKGVSVDVLGSTLTGMSLTFGSNLQHTVYVTVDHDGSDGFKNVTSEQARRLVEMIPQDTHLLIQNRAFEFPVLYGEWGEAWKDNGWAGFLPNAIDTKIGASYVDENMRLGLKLRSKEHLGYEQQTYDETTILVGLPGTLPAGGQRLGLVDVEVTQAVTEFYDEEEALENGVTVSVEKVRVVTPAVIEQHERRQYRMNELSASHVFGYGCDDTICTAALHTFYRTVMEMENTWQVYLDVEQLPEYLTSLAYVQGVPVDLGKLRAMEKEDRAQLAEAEKVLDEYLISRGWDGTVCPEYVVIDPAAAKEAVNLTLGAPEGAEEFTSRKRKLDALASDIRAAYPDNELAEVIASTVASGNAERLTEEVAKRFTGKPTINFGSPKQMQRLLYQVMGLSPKVFNKLTDKERQDEEFRRAFYNKRKFDDGSLDREPTEFERTVWMKKASTDDSAVELALHNEEMSDETRGALKAYLKVKEINTRISLFYNVYTVLPHWKTGRVHPELNQCEAATRRYSASAPNVQQLPSRGEGIKFRTLLPAPEGYIYVSLDFNGQELRLMAELSGDAAMISCYVGDNKRDIHSLIAVEASTLLWGERVEYPEFMAQRKSEDKEVSKRAGALRDSSKTVNFGTQYDQGALSLAIGLKTTEEVAQQFIDAKALAFPGIDVWKQEIRGEVQDTGLAYTMLGARRHLREAVNSPHSWIRSKADRQGPNFCIQGSGAEMAKLALARLWSDGMFTGDLDAQFVAPVHDEVVFMVRKEDAVEAIRRAHLHMTAQYADMKIPIVSAIAVGKDFSCPVEVGDDFDADEVAAAVASL